MAVFGDGALKNEASQIASYKEPPAKAGDQRDVGLLPGLRRSPGGGHSNPLSILSWRIPWIEEHPRIPSIGSQELDMTERFSRGLSTEGKKNEIGV